jgi:hypothetical protein
VQYAILFSENKRRAEMREHSITTEMLLSAVLFCVKKVIVAE